MQQAEKLTEAIIYQLAISPYSIKKKAWFVYLFLMTGTEINPSTYPISKTGHSGTP